MNRRIKALPAFQARLIKTSRAPRASNRAEPRADDPRLCISIPRFAMRLAPVFYAFNRRGVALGISARCARLAAGL